MRASYSLQHQVLPMLVHAARPNVLEEKIAANDQEFAENMMKAAMELSRLSDIDYEVEFAGAGKYDFMVYHMYYDIARVTDSRYIVICSSGGNRCFTVEYSYGHSFALCEWRNRAHINYGDIDRDTDIRDILDKIASILDKD